MNRHSHRSREELERRRIDRALAGLEDAVRRCRDEDVRYGTGVFAALEFLALRADEKWPFEQFRKANPGMDGTKPEARWQTLNASLNAIKVSRARPRFGSVITSNLTPHGFGAGSLRSSTLSRFPSMSVRP
jgi:hypothetical protein